MSGEIKISPEWANAIAPNSKTVENAPVTTADRLTAELVLLLEQDARKLDTDSYYVLEKTRPAVGETLVFDMDGALERFRDQRTPRFDDPEVQAVIRDQAVTGRAFSAAYADALDGRNAGKTPAEYLREAEYVQRQQEALDRAVAELTRSIEPSTEELARLRQALADEARRLAQTSGHTFESALARVTDMLSGIVVRPQWEDLREQVERLTAGLCPAPEVFVGIDLAAREPLFPPIPSAARRHRNKYAARPPGKR